jgi:hypothetical protein
MNTDKGQRFNTESTEERRRAQQRKKYYRTDAESTEQERQKLRESIWIGRGWKRREILHFVQDDVKGAVEAHSG